MVLIAADDLRGGTLGACLLDEADGGDLRPGGWRRLRGPRRSGLLREALPLTILTAMFVLAIVGILRLTSEPHVVESLLAQGGVPWAGEQRVAMLVYLMRKSPEIGWFSLIGGLLWATGRYRNRELLILALLLWLSAVVTCGKRGSDLNYFLSLRIVEALAAGTLCAAVLRAVLSGLPTSVAGRWGVSLRLAMPQPPCPRHAPADDGWPRPWLLAAMLSFGVFAMLPSTLAMTCATRHALAKQRMWRDGDADVLFAERDRLATLAAKGDGAFLTDDDQLAVFQGQHAAILDTYLFRLRAESGAIDIAPLVDRLRAGALAYVVLSADVAEDYPDTFFWRLPDAVADAVRQHYQLSESSGPWWVYTPRQNSGLPK